MASGDSIEFDRLARLISENFGAFFAIVDFNGQLLRFDKSKATLLGLNLERLEGVSVSEQLLTSIPANAWPIELSDKDYFFPRAEYYPKANRSVLWEADVDSEQGTILLFGNTVDSADSSRSEFDQLAERVRRHDRLLGNLPGMVYRCRVDRDWTMEYVSEGVVALTGYTREQLQSGEISWGGDVIVEKHRQAVWEAVISAIQKREPFTLYYQYETREGKIQTAWERGMGIFDARGDVIALEGFVANATPLIETQAELRDTNTKLTNLLNAATQTAVIMTNTDGVITTFNRGAENLLGYAAEEVVGLATPILFHDASEIESHGQQLSRELGETIAGMEALIALAKRGRHDRSEWNYVRKDGSQFPVELIVTAVRDGDGELIGFLGVAEDVSEQQQTQLALREAKERAEASNRAKDEFLAVISHEMRTPLNPILGFSNMLLQECKDADTRESLEIIERSAYKLLHQIEDILDFIGIDKQKTKVDLRPAPLWAFAQTVSRDLESLSNGNEFQVVNGCGELAGAVDGSTSVLIDHELTSQIIANLVTNAFKFTLRGKVTLRVGWRSGAGGVVRFEIIDNGIGIARDKHDAIFLPFTQVESNYTRRYEGVGLGLAICAKLIDVLNGKIGFESEVDEGSTFWFELPAEAVSSEEAVDELSDLSVRAFANTRILVVEDNPDNRKLIVGLLQRIGADVMTAPDGPTAVERCRMHDYHVVLMDISMPEMDGFETTQRILGVCRNEPKIIAVTAHASEGMRAKCLECGMVDFLPKPVSLDALRNLLEVHQGVYR
ncbi:hybrid sensor histidine kinase/response regulator [Cerasicoccus frondis]|uniref:hybrid sensor histidine kinase/response regulator n=1 Tax=Cerasicoccus frondis TaxID=490090 RepID=UPI002852B5F6|nr:PAS domain S-box protein [Cerasicoccus frondis]